MDVLEKKLKKIPKTLPLLEDLCQKVPIPQYHEQLTWVKDTLAELE
jgi:hypothetical protein